MPLRRNTSLWLLLVVLTQGTCLSPLLAVSATQDSSASSTPDNSRTLNLFNAKGKSPKVDKGLELNISEIFRKAINRRKNRRGGAVDTSMGLLPTQELWFVPPVDKKHQYPPTISQPLHLGLPPTIQSAHSYNASSGNIIFRKQIDSTTDYLFPRPMTLKEYLQKDMDRQIQIYFHNHSLGKSDEGGKSVLDSLTNLVSGDLASMMSSLSAASSFSGSLADSLDLKIRATGYVEIPFAYKWFYTENPSVSETQRSSGAFDFSPDMNVNVDASLGKLLKIKFDYSNLSLSSLANQIKLSYNGNEDEIIKNFELGNISYDVPNQLIQGSSNLKGVKATLQFGKLYISPVFAIKQGSSSSVSSEGGAQIQKFTINASDYEAKKHYFLSHYFRERFNRFLENPAVLQTEGVRVLRVEVWLTNLSADYSKSRNVLALQDLGEEGKYTYRQAEFPEQGQVNIPNNQRNSLYNAVRSISGIRERSQTATAISMLPSMEASKDYLYVESAQKLEQNKDFHVEPDLGYISLYRTVQDNQMLAVAYEVSYQGKKFYVGELSTQITGDSVLITKLLQPQNANPILPNWKLMMKNIYTLSSRQVKADGFELHVEYKDDSLGSFFSVNKDLGKRWVQLLGFDRLNSSNAFFPDGRFDVIEGRTLFSERGLIVLPVTEPFGEHIKEVFASQPQLAQKYAYTALYDSIITQALEFGSNDKFRIAGQYKGSAKGTIRLNVFRPVPGSVVVKAGERTLKENVDYLVNYNVGEVQIINQALLNSQTPITASAESQGGITLRQRTFWGGHLEYKFNKNFTVGATFLNLFERPVSEKVTGEYLPVSNAMYGLNTSLKVPVPALTRWASIFPGVSTKKASTIAFRGDAAWFRPGHNTIIQDNGSVYIDDFENSKLSQDLRAARTFKLGASPIRAKPLSSDTGVRQALVSGYQRAKLSWFQVDNIFYWTNENRTPASVKSDEVQSDLYQRRITQVEIFPYKEFRVEQSQYIRALDLVYDPRKRGPYNYNPDLNFEGELRKPKDSWAAITRSITNPNLEAAGAEHIEFWLLDPFMQNPSHEGGKLSIHLGDISEDILPDKVKSYESGVSIDDASMDISAWARTPKLQNISDVFSNDAATQAEQDVGLDGASNQREREGGLLTGNYFAIMRQKRQKNQLSESAFEAILSDPSEDDFVHFLDASYDLVGANIHDRYTNYNGTEGNSLLASGADASSTTPDVEDVNNDKTLDMYENYFQYDINISPSLLDVSTNPYIVQERVSDVVLANGRTSQVRWLKFSIPLRKPSQTVGSINNFRSIRFMRLFLSEFAEKVVLRFGALDIVQSTWRQYSNPIKRLTPSPQTALSNASVALSSVGLEETPGYVLPPGISRQVSPNTTQTVQQDEQSLELSVNDLEPYQAKAIYKRFSQDIRTYKRMKMFVHLRNQEETPSDIQSGDLSLFVRIGNDMTDNYYEYELPLEVSAIKNYNNDLAAHRNEAWPAANRVAIPLDELKNLKLQRNTQLFWQKPGTSPQKVFERVYDRTSLGSHYLRVIGHPSMNEIRTLMIGIKNKGNRGQGDKSFRVWINELRLSEFEQEGGMATQGTVDIAISDLTTLSVGGKYSSVGFGQLEDKFHSLSTESSQNWDAAARINTGKLLPPKVGLSLPVYLTASNKIKTPKYDPFNPDLDFEKTQAALREVNKRAADSIAEMVITQEMHQSISANARLTGLDGKKKNFYDIGNLTSTVSYSQRKKTDPRIEYNITRTFKNTIAYNHAHSPKHFAPLKKSKFFQSSVMKIIGEFNVTIVPSKIHLSSDIDRTLNEVKERNVSGSPELDLDPIQSNNFRWTKKFAIRFPLTKKLSLEYDFSNKAQIHNRYGKDSLFYDYWNPGTPDQFQHNIRVNYELPINKLPMMDFTRTTANYNTTYNWKSQPYFPPYVKGRDTLGTGHTISNTNTLKFSTTWQMAKLYAKVPLLKETNQATSPSARKQNKNKYTISKTRFQKGVKRIFVHRLGTKEVLVSVKEPSGKKIKGTITVLDENRIAFVPEESSSQAKVIISKPTPNPATWLWRAPAYVITSVKNIQVSYTRTQQSKLPGFTPSANLVGLDETSEGFSPGWDFFTGFNTSQYGLEAARKGWRNARNSNHFTFSIREDRIVRVTITPLRSFNINLSSSWKKTTNEHYQPIEQNDEWIVNGQELLWTANSTFLSIGTLSKSPQAIFEQLRKNAVTVSQRINAQYTPSNIDKNPDGTHRGFNLSSPDVLIPSFRTALSGGEPSNTSLDPIPSVFIPVPNWTLSYSGLKNLPWIRKHLVQLTLKHSYKSTFSLGSFYENPEYDPTYKQPTSENLNHQPKYVYSSVGVKESFSPFFGISSRFKNGLSMDINYNRGRSLVLNLSNNNIVSTTSNGFVVRITYIFDKLPLITIRRGDNSLSAKNVFTFRTTISMKDNTNSIYNLLNENFKISSGEQVWTVKPSLDYQLSRWINVRVFYDWTSNSPYTTQSFYRNNQKFGISFRVSIL